MESVQKASKLDVDKLEKHLKERKIEIEKCKEEIETLKRNISLKESEIQNKNMIVNFLKKTKKIHSL